MVLFGLTLTRFNTQPPKGGWGFRHFTCFRGDSFNTQPPKGGWQVDTLFGGNVFGFNTQPPKGGWAWQIYELPQCYVSTHSRLKAAGAVV